MAKKSCMFCCSVCVHGRAPGKDCTPLRFNYPRVQVCGLEEEEGGVNRFFGGGCFRTQKMAIKTPKARYARVFGGKADGMAGTRCRAEQEACRLDSNDATS
jgi:hypothetical protein